MKRHCSFIPKIPEAMMLSTQCVARESFRTTLYRIMTQERAAHLPLASSAARRIKTLIVT
jgi:hypothetical protein